MNTVFRLTVTIRNDTLTEGPEVFFMRGMSNANRVVVRPDRANVTIFDNDRKYKITF